MSQIDIRAHNPMRTVEERDRELQELWDAFGDVPMNPVTECMDEPVLGFPAGTSRWDILHWFDKRHSKGVAYLMYGEDAGRKDDTTMLTYYSGLCFDCESRHCAYNVACECRYPMVHHRLPNITDDDGCTDYVWMEVEDGT